MIYNTILDAVGNTPLIRLNHIGGGSDAEILVKFEAVNVGASIKTRTALGMIEAAEKEGKITKDTVIVEPTSGNQGIGLALVSAVKGYRAIIIMPDSVSEERRKLICQYGAEVKLVHDEGDIGQCIRTCMETAEKMKRENKNVFVPQQFENDNNVRVHYEQTGKEILRQAEKKIDGFCSGIGTGGTITGIGKALKEANPDILIWAVEPEKAAVLSGYEVKSHLQMGIGDGIIPEILDRNIYDDIMIVTDEEAIRQAKELARKEGLLCGISGGTNVVAARRLAQKLGKGKTVVTILPDTAERYFSTPLFM
nr:cysteine synthase A [uncultured Sellimonas sp.]